MYTEAQKVLQDAIRSGLVSNTKFANDIAYTRRVTEKRGYWIEKLVSDANAKQTEATTKTPDISLQLSGLIDLFTTAGSHLKYPKIVLSLDGVKDGRKLTIKRAGPRSKHAGSLMLSNGRAYGDPSAKYYGKISPDGNTFFTNQGKEADLTALLVALTNNPAEIAAEHGKILGSCCFCLKSLSDDRSLSVGYGPICADHWSLPWGSATTSQVVPVPGLHIG